jgi:hypothetical protein
MLFRTTDVLKKGVMNMGIKLLNELPFRLGKWEKCGSLKGEIPYIIHLTLNVALINMTVKLGQRIVTI